MSDTTTARRVDKLSSASLNRIVEPDRDLPGGVGDAQLIADELLLSVAGLEPGGLSRDQMVTLMGAGFDTTSATLAWTALPGMSLLVSV